MIARQDFHLGLTARKSLNDRMSYVCRVLGVILSVTGEDIEVTHIGNGEITFYTTTKNGVKVIQKALKPYFAKGALKLVEIRTYAADPSIDYPESYLVCVEPGERA